MEWGIGAVEDACRPDPLDRLRDLVVHGHAGGFEVDVGTPAGDVDAGVDVDDVAAAHVAEDDVRVGILDGELLDRPRQREDRVAAVDEYRKPACRDDLHQRAQRGVVGVEGVEQRMQLDAKERRLVKQTDRLLDVARYPRIGPDQPVGALDALDAPLHLSVVGREHATLAQGVLLHQRRQPIAIKRDIEVRIRSDVRVGVKNHACLLGARWVPAPNIT